MKQGTNCNIHPTALFFGDNIEIGNNVRIDAFAVITGNVRMGNNIHIGCYDFLSGGDGLVIEDFVGISPRASIFTASDDYSGESMSNPIIPDQFKYGCQHGQIVIQRHVLIGANVVILPEVNIGEGCSIGAFSLIKHNLQAWGIYKGIPAKRVAERSKNILDLEKEYLAWQQRQI